ncbi:MAG: efflux RND transporter periplasmic adaptor subunit [Gammaproteobacteria bacterium]|nr:efflux RND transporter periplasmic adaptor subunit [Gammaproteobacteria bacterium]
MKPLNFIFIFFTLMYSVGAYAQEHNEKHENHEAHTNHKQTEHRITDIVQQTKYVCPMHSHIIQDHPGSCPICGMDLVARNSNKGTKVAVEVSGEMQQAMALTTETVTSSKLWRFIKTYGAVEYDEKTLMHLHPRSTGWVEKLYINSVGQHVDKGELLYEIYSPELLVAQEEFLSLLADNNKVSNNLIERSIKRLRLLGFNDALIEQLKDTRQALYLVPYYAKQNSVVSHLDVREGMYVEPKDELMTLADISNVWVVANVFENQMNWVESSQSLELDLPAVDIYGLEGRVEFIYPTLDPVTRTLQVRMSLSNKNKLIKPGMLANVRIYSGAVEALNIPVNALIQTEKSNAVFVQTEQGLFERRSIEIGLITNQRVEIQHGLSAGERVVTSGQFLLDAEASLSNTATLPATTAHQH